MLPNRGVEADLWGDCLDHVRALQLSALEIGVPNVRGCEVSSPQILQNPRFGLQRSFPRASVENILLPYGHTIHLAGALILDLNLIESH